MQPVQQPGGQTWNGMGSRHHSPPLMTTLPSLLDWSSTRHSHSWIFCSYELLCFTVECCLWLWSLNLGADNNLCSLQWHVAQQQEECVTFAELLHIMRGIPFTWHFHLLADQASSDCWAAFLPCSSFLGDYCVVHFSCGQLERISLFSSIMSTGKVGPLVVKTFVTSHCDVTSRLYPATIGGSRICFRGGAQGQVHPVVYWLHSSEDPTAQVTFFNKHG